MEVSALNFLDRGAGHHLPSRVPPVIPMLPPASAGQESLVNHKVEPVINPSQANQGRSRTMRAPASNREFWDVRYSSKYAPIRALESNRAAAGWDISRSRSERRNRRYAGCTARASTGTCSSAGERAGRHGGSARIAAFDGTRYSAHPAL